MAHLAQARLEVVQSRRICRATWIRRSLVTAVVTVMSMLAIYVFLTRRHEEATVAPSIPALSDKAGTPSQVLATATYVPVLVDLSSASPVRGLPQRAARPSLQVIPSRPFIDLSLRLPLGSEERGYSVRLSSNRQVVWSGSAQARPENGRMLLHMHADFSHVPTGNYDLAVVSKGFRLFVPVIVKSTSPGGFQ
jgi:hypothetical protein